MIARTLSQVVLDRASQYPVVTITGPRQSGKTTLCRHLFSNKPYVNLESRRSRGFAESDPEGFLAHYPDGAIIDEIQRVPELASDIQARVDDDGRPGLFILTGSQQLEVSQTVSQSLAGRSAIVRLLPFSLRELAAAGNLDPYDDYLYRGFYPRIYDRNLEAREALASYLETYVERDLRQLSAVRDLSLFQKFMSLCAGRIGQLLNLESLGNDTGVSATTARHWITLLEASYVIFRLHPYHRDVSKRLIRRPKLYFHDVGLAAHLLGIESAQQISSFHLRGLLFENLVAAELMKYRWHAGRRANLYFYRDRAGNEVDLLCAVADRFIPIEVKSGSTINADYFRGLRAFAQVEKELPYGQIIVFAGKEQRIQHGIHITIPVNLVERLQQLEVGNA